MSAASLPVKECPLPAVLDAMAVEHEARMIFRAGRESVSRTHTQCRADAGSLAVQLRRRGIGPGSRVALHGATSYEWVLADLACVLLGALSVALYSSAPPARAVVVARDSRCRLVLTDRPDCVAAFRAAGLDVIFLGAGQCVTDGPGGGLESVADLVAAATAEHGPAPSRQGPFTAVSTSGTLSEPKMFTVAAEPLLFTMDRFAEIYGFGRGDRLILYLPLSHLPQRMMLYWGLLNGLDFVLSDPVHMPADSVAHRPTLHVAVPRVLEHVRWQVATLLRASGHGPTSPEAAAAYRSVLGPDIRSIFVGSAPTEPGLMTELLAAELPVFEMYGTTELGMIAVNTPSARRPGTVGKPIPWGEVRLDPQTHEVLVRTPTPFLHGRLLDGEIEENHWAPGRFEPTADAGEFDVDGFLSVRGRLRDFMALPTGEKVFVTPIETALAKATGAGLCQLAHRPDGRLGALLFFDAAVPGIDELDDRVHRVNRELHPWERVRSYAVVSRMPTVEEGCLTETAKPRRHVIDEVHGRVAHWRRLAAATEPAS